MKRKTQMKTSRWLVPLLAFVATTARADLKPDVEYGTAAGGRRRRFGLPPPACHETLFFNHR